MKQAEIKRFAAAAKQQGIVIEVEKDGVIVRFFPDARAESALDREERELDAEIDAFNLKHGYEPRRK